jgi:hypothetical protein
MPRHRPLAAVPKVESGQTRQRAVNRRIVAVMPPVVNQAATDRLATPAHTDPHEGKPLPRVPSVRIHGREFPGRKRRAVQFLGSRMQNSLEPLRLALK